jgi:hypothetical protein
MACLQQGKKLFSINPIDSDWSLLN